ncbi:MAG: lipase family alpha/beta hydrolase [Bacteroidota bacterium]
MSSSMRHMIILLPGIMGSALQKDGKDLWALSGQALWQYLTNLKNTVQQMRLGDEDWTVDDRGDGVHASRLIEDLHSIPPFVEHAGYSVIRKGIREFFGLTEGSIDSPSEQASFYPFPYDFRRDNRVAARKLQEFVQAQLPKWRAWSGADDAQVILIGHSMGGLVSRYYLEVLGGWRDCIAAITVGSPHRGAIGAIDGLSNGVKKLAIDFTDVMRSFPSAYQIAPTYPVVKSGHQYVRASETDDIPNVDQARAKAGRDDFLDAIRLAAIENRKDPQYVQRLIPWVGTRQDTQQSAVLSGGKLIPSYDAPAGLDPSLVDGDGTVPRVSAVPADLDGQRLERFAVERHGWLTNNPMTLQPLLATLQQIASPGAGDMFGIEPEAPQPAINLRMDSLFLKDEPVSIRVKLVDAGEAPQNVTLHFRPVGHAAEELAQTVSASAAEPVDVELSGLAPGLYELTAGPETPGAGAPGPTHGVFEVAESATVD